MNLRYNLLKGLGVLFLAGGIYAGSKFLEDKDYLERNRNKFEFRREGNFTVVPYERFEVERKKRNNGLLAILGFGLAATFLKGSLNESKNINPNLTRLLYKKYKNDSKEKKISFELGEEIKSLYSGKELLESQLDKFSVKDISNIKKIGIYENQRKFFGIPYGKISMEVEIENE